MAPISIDPAHSRPAAIRPRRVALAYSGGLASSCLIPWLKQHYGCEVIAVVADIGQPEGVAGLEERALASGAAACHVLDLREALLTEHLFPVLQAGVPHDRDVLSGPAMAYPLIARHQVEIALREDCDALAHGAGPDTGQAGFDLTYQALAPMLRVLGPGPMWRAGFEAADLAATRGEPEAKARRRGDHDRDPGERERSEAVGEKKQSVVIEFARGVPVALDGRRLGPVALLPELTRLGGPRSRDGQEAGSWPGKTEQPAAGMPAARLLARAHRDLERRVLDPATQNLKNLLAHIYADVVYNGTWFSPLREALDAFVTKTQEPVSGEIRLQLAWNHGNAANERLPGADFDTEGAARDADDVYHQATTLRLMNLTGYEQHAAVERERRLRERDMVILK